MSVKKKKEKKSALAKQIAERKISSDWYYAIKWIAIISMLIDHTSQTLCISCDDEIRLTMRVIGRLAFPLFAWELSECFHHTEYKWKHFFKIGIFAVLSEIPFDKALKGSFYNPNFQNVCFTLLIGWLMLICINFDWKHFFEKCGFKKGKIVNNVFSKMAGLSFCLPLFGLAYLLKVDFSYYGIGLILLFEFARKIKNRKLMEFIAISSYIGLRGIVMTRYYSVCFICLILFYLAEWDKGEKEGGRIEKALVSRPAKFLAMSFYPLHLTILMMIMILGEYIK